MRKNWPKIAFVFILFLALFLRIVALGSFPLGFTADEAAQGYTAWSILKTGRDEWGKFLPLFPRSFGDFKPPLYTYLIIPSVAIFGLNEFAVRLPSALFGTLAVLMTFLVVKELFRSLRNVDYFALIASLLLAISPWHLSLSRGAFEANLTVFFLTAGFYFFLKGVKQSKFLLLAALFFGLNLFSYHSARLVTPLFLGFLIWWKRKEIFKKKSWGWWVSSFCFFSLFLGGTIWMLLGEGKMRVTDIGIFSTRWQIPKIFIRQYLSYLSGEFFFTKGAGEATYGMIPGRGVVYLFELPALIFAFVWLVKKWNNNFLPILVWITLAPIPAALSFGVGYHANRVAVMMPAIQILSAFGLLVSFDYLKKFFQAKLLFSLYSFVFVLSFSFFIYDYFIHSSKILARGMGYGWREAMNDINQIEDKYSKIIVSRSFSEPQTFVAFYKKWDPWDFQKQSNDWLRYQKDGLKFVDQLGSYSLGKYEFRDIHWQQEKNLKNVVLVVKANEVPFEESINKRIIPYPDGEPAFLIVEKI